MRMITHCSQPVWIIGRNDTLKFIKIDTRNQWEDGDGNLNCYCVCVCVCVKQRKQSKLEIVRFF